MIGDIFKTLARYAIPLFKQGANVVGKRALQAATYLLTLQSYKKYNND
jgi:hypothetical protein